MPSFSQYTPNVVTLDGGLDLANPKQAIAPGTLSDCNNFEVAERVGYKIVDGIVRHDGQISPSVSQEFESIFIVSNPSAGQTAPVLTEPGDILTLNGSPWARVVSTNTFDTVPTTTEYTSVWVFGDQSVVLNGTTVYTLTNTTHPESFTGTLRTFAQNDSYTALGSAMAANTAYDQANALIETLPDGRRAHGLHWFRDRLYGVVNMLQYGFTSGSEEVFPGDEIEDQSGNTAIVQDVELVSGVWASGTAAGNIWIIQALPNPLTVGNEIDINRPSTGSETDAFTLGALVDADNSEYASLWHTNEEEFILRGEQTPGAGEDNHGWYPVDMGFEIGFEDGSYVFDNFNTLNRTNADIQEEFAGVVVPVDTADDGAGPQLGVVFNQFPPFQDVNGNNIFLAGNVPTTVTNLGTPTFYDAQDTDALIIATTAPTTVTQTQYRFSNSFTFSDFHDYSAIPAGSNIVGIEIQVRAWQEIGMSDTLPTNEATAFVGRVRRVTESGEVVSESRFTELDRTGTSTANAVVVRMGGPTDVFGLDDDLRIEDISPTNFLVDFAFFTLPQTLGLVVDREINIDFIKVVLYYRTPDSKVFFWNEVDDVSGNLVASWVRDGSLLLGNGTGRLHVYNVEGEAGAIRNHINVGDEIRTAPAGAGQLLGIVAEFVKGGSLPGLQQMVEKRSLCEFVTANFYANDDWNAFYGVTGAGRAFVFDQLFFRYIYTGLPDNLDLPRHVEHHHQHLALGYTSGSVFISVVGEPENFRGEDGAYETSTGDRVTGLLSLPGTALGVGCQDSIWAIYGTTIQNFQTQVLRPKEGVIEYTLADVGVPVYCSTTGINVFATTPAYGDFQGEKISYRVYPFLYPRLYRTSSRGNNLSATGVVCALPRRRKNQYLVFFQDGKCLCMTMAGQERGAQFTFRQYYSTSESRAINNIIVPFGYTSLMDSLGRERTFISHYATVISNGNSTAELRYPFELDRGWSFAGAFIDADFTTNYNFVQNSQPKATDEKIQRKATLFGLGFGASNLSVQTGQNFEPPDGTRIDVSIPQTRTHTPMEADFTPFRSQNANLAERGQSISLKVTNVTPLDATDGTPVNRILPPVVLQEIVGEFIPAQSGR